MKLEIKLIIYALLMALMGVIKPSLAAEPILKMSNEQMNTLGISLAHLKSAPQIPVLYAPAKVVVPPKHEYIISTAQAGLIVQLSAGLGDEITQGDSVAELDSPELLSLQAQFLKANSLLNLATIASERDKTLAQEGVIATRRQQESHAEYTSAALDLNEARQRLQIAGMTNDAIQQLIRTQRLSSRLTIHSPVSGVIMERLALAGERVNSLTPLYRLADLSELWLRINIPQERIYDIALGDKVLVEDTQVSAAITALGKSVEASDQTLLARAVVKGKPLALHVGQSISVQIIKKTTNALDNATGAGKFIVPNSAIMQNEGKAYVFMKIPEGFAIKNISILGRQNEESIIGVNLTEHEEIAIQGTVALKAAWLGLGSLQ